MTEVICILPETKNGILNQEQVLLDERYASFGYWMTEECYCRAGGRNDKLKKGWQYELLVRLAEKQKIGCISDKRVKEEWAVMSDFDTDAYVLSRYSDVLRENGFFEPYLADCIQRAMCSGNGEAMGYLEDMLGKSSKYWELYLETQPFLILLTAVECYNILNDMAQNLAQGLRVCGKNVEIYDLAEGNSNQITRLFGKYYQAVIGLQSKLFEAYLNSEGCFLVDLIHGPKLQLLFDHPFWFYKQLQNHGEQFFLLTHDESYVNFIQKYAPDVQGSFLLPVAGVVQQRQELKRDLDVIFLGTYWNYRVVFEQLQNCGRDVWHTSARYIKYLKKWVNHPSERAFGQMLADYGIKVNKEEFVRMMYKMGGIHQCIIAYYREKIIQILLESGITLHVFGKCWKKSPFAESDRLICHEEVVAQDSKNILQRAKISLNILSWHKGGCNERLINSMLAGAAVVTDMSSYIKKHFIDGSELYCYDLQKLEKLPQMIKMLLEQEEMRQKIAENGRRKAEKEFNNIEQAKRVISITQQINGSNGLK